VKPIRIDLNDSFKKTCDAVLVLPDGGDDGSAQRETVAEELRYLYVAAHGTALKTSIGHIRIMPPIDPFLIDAPLSLVTRSDLLTVAERRTAFAPRVGRNASQRRRRWAAETLLIFHLGAATCSLSCF